MVDSQSFCPVATENVKAIAMIKLMVFGNIVQRVKEVTNPLCSREVKKFDSADSKETL